MNALWKIQRASFFHIARKGGSTIAAVLIFSISSFSQISGVDAEGPRTLGKNRYQLALSYNALFPSDGLWVDRAINRVTLKAGIGLLEHVDLKFSYSKWLIRGSNYDQNVFHLVTKFSGDNEYVAFYLPVGLICSKYRKDVFEDTDDEYYKHWVVTPRLIINLFRRDRFDMCLIPYMEIISSKLYGPLVTGGLNIGMGYCFMEPGVSIRVEGGIDLRSVICWFPWGNAGITVSYFLGGEK